MKLELKYLAPYLPYDLKVKYTNKYNHSQIITLVGVMNHITKGKDIQVELCNKNLIHLFSKIEGVKPILRPLSDLTKEIEVNGEEFVPLDWLRKNIDEKLQFSEMGFYDYEVKGLINKLHYSLFDVYQYEIELSEIIKLTQKLFEWHFDVFGLIEKGLAIDINTL